MKVTLVSIVPSEAQIHAGCPELTTEMMTAVAARYSRNDEGIDAILELIGKKSQDTAIDSIFKMVDYGHASIADMAPVPIFIDGISIWLTYYIWSICPRASGQETSTRYVKYDEGGILSAFMAGVPPNKQHQWNKFITDSIQHYVDATAFWSDVANNHPELVRIPQADYEKSLIEGDEGHKARLKVDRLKRNFVFDRARYFIPVAALTNVMLIMPARDWVDLVKTLRSHYIREANVLAERLQEQLTLVVPRLMKHCHPTKDYIQSHLDDMKEDIERALIDFPTETLIDVQFDVHDYFGLKNEIADAFKHHHNRYAPIGRAAKRLNIKYIISGIAMAELRDLNRHRTGTKYTPTGPLGFYCAEDQLPNELVYDVACNERCFFGRTSSVFQRYLLLEKDQSHMYWGLLGTKYYFEHSTSLDKVAYEIALRTGSGSHFKYAEHMREVHAQLIAHIPELKGKILVGTAEPE